MKIQRVLVSIDGSELSLLAVDAAAELAPPLGACVTLLTAVEPPEAVSGYVSESTLEELRRGVWQAAEAMLEQAARRVRPVVPELEKRVVWGAPAAAIASEANTGYDLVVMGSRGLGMVPSERHLLGSVAERVLRRSHCPVPIIPGHAGG